MKDNLKNVINMQSAGLDDIMIKKILITYYRGLYLNDTAVLMELGNGTQEDIDDNDRLNKILQTNYGENITIEDIKPYECVEGNSDNAYGETGKIYIKSTGLIQIQNCNGDNLVYYPEETLKDIYEYEYKGSFEDEQETNYSKSVRKYLEKCYTYAENGIKMYCFDEHEKQLEVKYGDYISNKYITSESYSGSLVNIEFYDKISEYVTPIEFMIDLMEIIGSQDFIDSFIEMVGDRCYVKLQLLEIKNKNVNTIVEEKERQLTVYGKKPNIDYTVYVEKKDSEGNKTESQVDESNISREVVTDKEKINITVKNTYDNKYNFIIYAKNEDGSVKKVSDKYIDNGDSYTFEEENPNQSIKTKNSTINVKTEEIEQNINRKYDVGIKEVSTWYVYLEMDCSTEISTNYYTINENNEEIEIPTIDNIMEISQDDVTETYTNIDDSYYFSMDKTVTPSTDKKEIDKNAIAIQTLKTVETKESKYDPEDYTFYQTDLTDYNKKIKKSRKKETERASIGNVSKAEDRTDLFLAMLSNSTGKFDLNEGFVSKSAGGKIVKYQDLYAENSKTGPGELLTNGAEMLFQLLQESKNTQGLTNIMKYIMFRYSGIDYGVTNFYFSIYNMQSMSNNVTIIGDTVEDKVFYALKFAGYSDVAIAAVMGNIQAESGFVANSIESETGEGYGLCQWSFGRKEELINFAKSRGTTWEDVDLQIEFLLGEINQSGGADGYAKFQMGDPHGGYTYNSWKDGTDTAEATTAFMAVFERPNMEMARPDSRINAAKAYYEKYKDRDLNGGQESTEGTGNGILQRFTSYITGKTFTIYSQKEVGLSGECNRATAASIASGYRGDKTEMEVIKDVQEPGDYILTNPNNTKQFFDNYGLKAAKNPCAYSMDNVKKYLMQGSYVAIWFKYGDVYGKSGSQYNRNGSCHWVGIIGYKNTNGNEQIYISDPGYGSSGWKNIDEFEKHKTQITNFIVVSTK